VISLKWQW